jgi:hypothetical protein
MLRGWSLIKTIDRKNSQQRSEKLIDATKIMLWLKLIESCLGKYATIND